MNQARDNPLATLKAAIRDVPDFPKPGIIFKDITTLLKDPRLLRIAVDQLVSLCAGKPADKVAAIESRGFIFGSLVADRLGAGLVPVRKPGKLPAKTISASYELEYGTDTIEMHADGIAPNDRVLIVDDLIATGGTARAAAELVEKAGGQVEAFVFLIELGFLDGRAKLAGRDVRSVLQY